MHPSKFLEFAAYLGLTHGACNTNVTINGLGTASDGQLAINHQIALFSFGGSSCDPNTTVLTQDISYSHINIRSTSKSDWYSYYGIPTFDLSAHCDIQSSGVPLREFVQTGHFTWTLIPEQKITNIICETTPHTMVNFIGKGKDGTQVFRTEKVVGGEELGFRFDSNSPSKIHQLESTYPYFSSCRVSNGRSEFSFTKTDRGIYTINPPQPQLEISCPDLASFPWKGASTPKLYVQSS
ncbi:b0b9d53e-d7f1-4363-970d-8772a1745de5 [Sclerotinia trifoliorum]|uniref:B0b9d53e-d7f1-4363-970d-8772a1745de5 n=1 Tax=Sclerotinia trifoliorum TaxID=28548 RepID=A0A8H2VVZ7_9HELO|nr:b0b9d53e-d7f1-4363-970d-8772a1745de5 [Sclerotinia trifoliorum]